MAQNKYSCQACKLLVGKNLKYYKMKRLGNIQGKITNYENIYLAYKKDKKAKVDGAAVIWFTDNLE